MREKQFNLILESLNVYDDVLRKLQNSGAELVIGGSTALFLHGLEMPREIQDLDLIVYLMSSKSDGFREYLDMLKQNDPLSGDHKEIPEEYRRVVKMVRKFDDKEYLLDIIEENELLPNNLMYFADSSERLYKIQSISNVLKAKLSYRGEAEQKGPKEYIRNRKKDLEDLRDLKNANFNII